MEMQQKREMSFLKKDTYIEIHFKKLRFFSTKVKRESNLNYALCKHLFQITSSKIIYLEY